MLKYSKAETELLIEGIYNGSITTANIPENLYLLIVAVLSKGVAKGLGTTIEVFKTSEKHLIKSLRDNVFTFSGAKSYQEVRSMTDLLLDGDKIKSFSAFKRDAMATFDVFNKTWLETEYKTAIGQAEMISKWETIMEQRDTLPLLRYSAVIDDNTSDICAPLDGLVAKVDDPVWDTISPLNHFNCRCLLLQEWEGTETPERDSIKNGVEDQMNSFFKHNPYKTAQIFPKGHPYYRVPEEDKALAMNNFNLPMDFSKLGAEISEKPIIFEEKKRKG